MVSLLRTHISTSGVFQDPSENVPFYVILTEAHLCTLTEQVFSTIAPVPFIRSISSAQYN